MQPLKFSNSQIRCLKRHCAETDEAIRVARDNAGNVVVDRAGGCDAEVSRRVVISLVWRGCDRLDIDPHHVHIREPLFHRSELNARSFGLLPVDLARARIGKHVARPAFHLTGGAKHGFG